MDESIGDKIKRISDFSTDAINLMTKDINICPQLDLILERLGEKEVKKKKYISRRRTDEEIFQESIIPQIKRKVQENDGMDLNLTFQAPCREDPLCMSMDRLKELHPIVVKDEVRAVQQHLYISCYRGKMYISIRSKCETEKQFSDLLRSEFGICKRTADRYMCVSLLVNKLPGLYLSGLSFNQLQKHCGRILKNEELVQLLSCPVVLHWDEGDDCNIIPCSEDIPVPQKQRVVDPDEDYLDEDFPDPKINFDWIADEAEQGRLLSLFNIEGDEEMDTCMESLSKCKRD